MRGRGDVGSDGELALRCMNEKGGLRGRRCRTILGSTASTVALCVWVLSGSVRNTLDPTTDRKGRQLRGSRLYDSPRNRADADGADAGAVAGAASTAVRVRVGTGFDGLMALRLATCLTAYRPVLRPLYVFFELFH